MYVRIRKNWLSVRDATTGAEFQEIPRTAVRSVNSRREFLAFGEHAVVESGKAGVEIVNGFDHPRSVINDFEAAEAALAHFLKQIPGHRFFRASPVLIMHVQEKMQGGLTQVEVRAIRELGAGAGGRAVYIWEGENLSDQAILTRRYPRGRWLEGPPR